MNKQELIEIIIKNIDDIGAYALGAILAQGILGLRSQVNGLREKLKEPSREECVPIHKLIDPRYSDYRLYCNFCDTEISSDDNYCGSCGRKIKREKRDDK